MNTHNNRKSLDLTITRLEAALNSRVGSGFEAASEIASWCQVLRQGAQLAADERTPGMEQVAHEALEITVVYVEIATELQHELIDQKYWNEELTTANTALSAANAQLQAEVTRLTTQLATRPAASVVEIPAQTVVINSDIDREILRLLAAEGLSRSWRVQQRVTAAALTQNTNAVRNALNRLKRKGVVADYIWNGRPQAWTPIAGGARRLVQLTDLGRAWAKQALQLTAQPCELDAMARKHKGVDHAVAILEAQDFLTALDYVVNTNPPALLYDEVQPYGPRVEPDLLATDRKGRKWPVEVQREVAERNNNKWFKHLVLDGGLLLIVVNEKLRERQATILAAAYQELPPGEIRLISLEALERGAATWSVFRSSIQRAPDA